MWSYFKEILDDMNKYKTLLVGLVTGFGVLVVFSYCAFVIGFFPKGLSLFDTLAFIFVGLGFGLLYFTWLFIGFITVYCLMYPFHKELRRDDRKDTKAFVFIVGLVFIALNIVVSYVLEDPVTYLSSVASGAMILISTFFWEKTSVAHINKDKKSIENKKAIRIILILTGLVVIPFFAGAPASKITDSSLGLIGISHKNTSLLLSENNYKIVTSIARNMNIDMNACELENGEVRIVHNVRILWNGIGDTSLISLLNDGEPIVSLELDSSGVRLLNALGNNFEDCLHDI